VGAIAGGSIGFVAIVIAIIVVIAVRRHRVQQERWAFRYIFVVGVTHRVAAM
jgi:hypothetical protein